MLIFKNIAKLSAKTSNRFASFIINCKIDGIIINFFLEFRFVNKRITYNPHFIVRD